MTSAIRYRPVLSALAALLLLSCSDQGPEAPTIGNVVSGREFSFALVGDRAWCWGRNDVGQLGRGVGVDSTPAPIMGNIHFAHLTASERTACGVSTEDKVYCWGFGRIVGVGSAITPTLIDGPWPTGITYIGMGPTHGCVLGASGQAVCFGTNAFGELGDGTTQPVNSAFPATIVTGGHIFSQLAVGFAHACGLEAGKLWCWGTNHAGSFGPGYTVSQSYRTPSLVALNFDAIGMELGSAISCAFDVASQAWCWGSNLAAQLGRGIATASQFSADPALVSGTSRYLALALPSMNSTVAHTCGIDLTGATLCWGLGEASQLGRIATETCVVSSTTSYACSGAPAAIESTLPFQLLAPGRDHTCGLTVQGGVYCWGSDARKQLGGSIGGTTRTPVQVSFTP